MYYETYSEYVNSPTYNAESCHCCTGRFNADTMERFDVGKVAATTLYLCNACSDVNALCLDCGKVVAAGEELCTECQTNYN